MQYKILKNIGIQNIGDIIDTNENGTVGDMKLPAALVEAMPDTFLPYDPEAWPNPTDTIFLVSCPNNMMDTQIDEVSYDPNNYQQKTLVDRGFCFKTRTAAETFASSLSPSAKAAPKDTPDA